MAHADFEQTWAPRIGEPAARRLHRGATLLLLIPTMFFAVAIALGVLNGAQATSTFIVALATLGVGIVTFAIWLRSRILLAREMSAFLGTRISWTALPRMTPRSFDKWCRRRGIKPPEHPAAAGEQAGASATAAATASATATADGEVSLSA